MVAVMSEALALDGTEKVLEVGTGSGYQAAVLALLADRVFSLERIPALARRARKVLDACGYNKVNIRLADGTLGWQEMAPLMLLWSRPGPRLYPRVISISWPLVAAWSYRLEIERARC